MDGTWLVRSKVACTLLIEVQAAFYFSGSLWVSDSLARELNLLLTLQIAYNFFQFDSLHKAFDIRPIGLVIGIDGQQDFLFRHAGCVEFIAVLVFGFLFQNHGF